MKDAAFDLGARLDRDGGSKDAAVQASGDDDLSCDDVTLNISARSDDKPVRRNVASHYA